MDNYIIWRMSGTTSGAYCQQWIVIRGASCICDAVFVVIICNFQVRLHLGKDVRLADSLAVSSRLGLAVAKMDGPTARSLTRDQFQNQEKVY